MAGRSGNNSEELIIDKKKLSENKNTMQTFDAKLIDLGYIFNDFLRR